MCITLSDYCNIALREITRGSSSWHQNECSATSRTADSVTKRRPNGSFKWWGVYQGINSLSNGALCKRSTFILHLMLLLPVFIAHSAAHTGLDTYSPLTSFESNKKKKKKERKERKKERNKGKKTLRGKKKESGGTRWLGLTKRAVNCKRTRADMKAEGVSVCCRGEEERATLSAFCLQLRLCALLYSLTFADTSWLTYRPEQMKPNRSGPFGSPLVTSKGLEKCECLALAEKAALLRWPSAASLCWFLISLHFWVVFFSFFLQFHMQISVLLPRLQPAIPVVY